MTRVAAIDCGTNSIRLLIADIERPEGAQSPVLTDIVREMRVVRLGQGVDATGEFAADALERTLAATADYAELIRKHEATKVRFVATSATRDARNRNIFIDGVRELLGVEPEVVSGDEEAALSFAGASSVLPIADGDQVLVVDLGGGSTEFVLGTAAGVTAALSVDVGCVRMTERHLRSDPPTQEEITAAESDVDAAIDAALQVVPLANATAVVGVAGSITTITAHALKLPEYYPSAIHGAELSINELRAAADDLLARTRPERASLPYMHPGRVDVIGAGALIWRRILERLAGLTQGRIDSATASEHDILDGIALSIG